MAVPITITSPASDSVPVPAKLQAEISKSLAKGAKPLVSFVLIDEGSLILSDILLAKFIGGYWEADSTGHTTPGRCYTVTVYAMVIDLGGIDTGSHSRIHCTA